MILLDLKETSEIAKNFATVLAILVGGGWTFWRFVLQREAQAKVEFDVDIKIIGEHDGELIIELITTIENKGLVRHRISNFSFDLLFMTDKDAIIDGDERINFQLLFQKKIDKRKWVPHDWYIPYIDAGVKQSFRYLTHLPVATKFVVLYSTFRHPTTKKDFHTAQQLSKLNRHQLNRTQFIVVQW